MKTRVRVRSFVRSFVVVKVFLQDDKVVPENRMSNAVVESEMIERKPIIPIRAIHTKSESGRLKNLVWSCWSTNARIVQGKNPRALITDAATTSHSVCNIALGGPAGVPRNSLGLQSLYAERAQNFAKFVIRQLIVKRIAFLLDMNSHWKEGVSFVPRDDVTSLLRTQAKESAKKFGHDLKYPLLPPLPRYYSSPLAQLSPALMPRDRRPPAARRPPIFSSDSQDPSTALKHLSVAA